MNTKEEVSNHKVIDWVSGKLLHAFGDDNPTDETMLVFKKHESVSVENKKFDCSLAKEFNKLSIDERGRTLEDLHGVGPSQEESPEFVSAKMDELHEVIRNTPNKPSAYDQAIEQNEEYVKSRRFGLMFLRAELFDAPKAATRLLFFLRKKLEYFGADALTRGLRLGDLPEGAQLTLERGCFQVLPFRDRSGRLIFTEVMFFGERLFPHVNCYFLAKAFLCIVTFENDDEAQRNGAVDIIWGMDYLRADTDVDSKSTKEAQEQPRWLPLRINAIHLCNDMDPIKHFFARFTIALSGPELRTRFRMHGGTPTEVLFTLMTYGIPVGMLPFGADGKLKSVNSRWWLQMLKKQDSELRNGRPFNKIPIPTNNDVLFGKGETIQSHYGNQSLRQILELSFEEYRQMKKNEKTAHTRKVVDIVKSHGGRFLIRDNIGWWEEVEEDKARLKVAKRYADMKQRERTTGGVAGAAVIVTSENEYGAKKQRVEIANASILSTLNFPTEETKSCFTCL